MGKTAEVFFLGEFGVVGTVTSGGRKVVKLGVNLLLLKTVIQATREERSVTGDDSFGLVV